MLDLEEITKIEASATPGDNTPGKVYAMLKQRWQEDARDRETGLRLMFMAWAACAEFDFERGYTDDFNATSSVFQNVFQTLGGVQSDDLEFLYVVGHMARWLPGCIGDYGFWHSLGERFLDRFESRLPGGFSETHFINRGMYGDYFGLNISRKKT